tara:strand:+ start:134 stop:811 length:678 start_codon:yes stop_codon:yes gene_type:complete
MENLIIFLQSYILEMLIIFTGIVAIYGWSTRNKLICLEDAIKKDNGVYDKNTAIIKDSMDLLHKMVNRNSEMIKPWGKIVHRIWYKDQDQDQKLEAFRCGIEVLRKDLEDHIAISRMRVAVEPEFMATIPAVHDEFDLEDDEDDVVEKEPRLPSGSFKPGGEVYEAVHAFVKNHNGLNPMSTFDMEHVTQYTVQQCNNAVNEMIKRGLIVTEGNRRARKLFRAID